MVVSINKRKSLRPLVNKPLPFVGDNLDRLLGLLAQAGAERDATIRLRQKAVWRPDNRNSA